MNKNTESSVYVELDALTTWSSRMNNINEASISTLNSLVSTIKELDEYWVGNIATGFLNDTDDLIQNAKNCHNQMKDITIFLQEVRKVMDNQ